MATECTGVALNQLDTNLKNNANNLPTIWNYIKTRKTLIWLFLPNKYAINLIVIFNIEKQSDIPIYL